MSSNRLETLQGQGQGKMTDQPHCESCNQSFSTPKKLNDHFKFSLRHHQPWTSFVPGNQVQPQQPGKSAVSTSTVSTFSGNQNAENQSPKITLAQDGKPGWSVIPETEHQEVYEALRIRVHRESTLQTNNYITKPFDPKDYVDRRKCMKCKIREKDVVTRECHFHPKPLSNPSTPNQLDPSMERKYTCCNTPPLTPGCKTNPSHQFTQNYLYNTHKDFISTPPSLPNVPKYQAVTLDCEMAGVSAGPGEAILLCACDYLTGKVIINKYISPPERIIIMRSTIHGISRATLNKAITQGHALNGWKAAREELFKFIDSSTILIGHSLEHDLNSLRLIHPRIVDSGVLVHNVAGVKVGLTGLCDELLGIPIRRNKGEIHDCLEDVFATREVVLYCTRERKRFRAWAAVKMREQEVKREERERKREEKRQAKISAQGKGKEGLSEGDKAKVRGEEEMVRRVAEAREAKREMEREKEREREMERERQRAEKARREKEAVDRFKQRAERSGWSIR